MDQECFVNMEDLYQKLYKKYFPSNNMLYANYGIHIIIKKCYFYLFVLHRIAIFLKIGLDKDEEKAAVFWKHSLTPHPGI